MTMLKLLLKKQLTEAFRSFFFDAKKNKMRSKGAVVGWFVFFAVMIVGMLGGMFTSLSVSICGPLTQVDMGWLYFLLMGGISILLGAFGRVFNTFAGLYLAKDNDLLLSMPIPVRTIIAARLLNVYLMGAMYSCVVIVPALVVYWAVAGVTAARLICGLAFILIITTVVLLLSCLLGWVVAKISLRLKNKSYITVIVSLAFICVYYFVYFKANELIRMIGNAETYGDRIRGAAYGLYLFGRIGEGDWLAVAIFLALTAICFALVWQLLSRSFLRIATAGGGNPKTRKKTARIKAGSVFGALLRKELARFTSSANYMLNCGLGILMIPIGGVLLLIKGRELCATISGVFPDRPDFAAVVIGAGLCAFASMVDMTTPSVSLEGKSLWIPQSLPVPAKLVLRAKAAVQLILTALPMLFAGVCAALVVPASPAVKALVCAMPLAYVCFSALFGMMVGVRMPILNWTNELVPIKHSGSIASCSAASASASSRQGSICWSAPISARRPIC